jgi:hypothetical protein
MPNNLDNLTKDENGNIVTRPMTGWTMFSLADIAVGLAVEYVESPHQLETGSRKSLQLALTPQACLELAEALTRQARRLLDSTLPQGHSPN